MSLSLKCAQALRAKIEELVQGSGMTAEEALSCAVMLPAWEPGREYVKGQRVRHGGQLYEFVESMVEALPEALLGQEGSV